MTGPEYDNIAQLLLKISDSLTIIIIQLGLILGGLFAAYMSNLLKK